MSTISSCFERAKAAAPDAARLGDAGSRALLNALAETLPAAAGDILAMNALDLADLPEGDPKADRLLLTPSRLESIAADIRRVAELPSPVGRLLEERTLPSGLRLHKVSVPLGVVGIVYEARPNVTLDAAALCLRSGNVAVLKGGSDARRTNEAIGRMIRHVLIGQGVNPDMVMMLPADREAARALFEAVGFVDVLIPRGSQALIDAVRRESRVPVIETGAGVVHTYVDATADVARSAAVILNAKTRRVSVCNALDCLLVHASMQYRLPELLGPLAAHAVVLYADEAAYAALEGVYPGGCLARAEERHLGKEFLDHAMAVKVVTGLDEALAHIRRYSSKHTEAVLTDDDAVAARFIAEVDAAAVYVNASTAFTDGGEFGLGAEIGISTQKMHARGPMGLEALTSVKWIGTGDYLSRIDRIIGR